LQISRAMRRAEFAIAATLCRETPIGLIASGLMLVCPLGMGSRGRLTCRQNTIATAPRNSVAMQSGPRTLSVACIGESLLCVGFRSPESKAVCPQGKQVCCHLIPKKGDAR